MYLKTILYIKTVQKVALSFDWTVSTTLNSDHLPLLLILADDSQLPPRGGRSYSNFRKANWDDFLRESED